MDDDVAESSNNAPPAFKNTGRWTITSTYDVYMVDTPKNGGRDSPSKKDSDNGAGGPPKNGNDGDNSKNRGGHSSDDGDYNPDNEDDRSLGPEDEDNLNESLDNPYYDALCLRLVETTKRIKNTSQRLRDEEVYLNDRWTELHKAKEGRKAKLQQIEANNAPPHLRWNLLDEMDTAAEDSAISRRRWANDLKRPTKSRPPRITEHQVGTYKHAPEVLERRSGHNPPRDGSRSDPRDKRPLRPENPPRSIYQSRQCPEIMVYPSRMYVTPWHVSKELLTPNVSRMRSCSINSQRGLNPQTLTSMMDYRSLGMD